jgi:hypothetical protein
VLEGFTTGSRRDVPITDPLIREDYGDTVGSNSSSRNNNNNNSAEILFHTGNGEEIIVVQPERIRM